MATVGAQIRALLLADATVNQLVGDQIFPTHLPEGEIPPAVVYTVIDDNPVESLDGTTATRLKSARVQVDCYARPSSAGGGGYLQSQAIADAVEAVLGNLNSPTLNSTAPQRRDLYDNETGYYRASMDFEVWHTGDDSDGPDPTSTGDITLYVSATGDDSQGGTTPATALATLQKAVDLLPRVIRHKATINVGAGNFAGANIGGFCFRPANAAIDARLKVVGATTTFSSGHVTSFTTGSGVPLAMVTLTDTGQAWAVNGLKGKLLHVVLDGFDVYLPITKNTATSLTAASEAWPGTMANGLAFEVLDCATVINTPVPMAGLGELGVTVGLNFYGSTSPSETFNDPITCELLRLAVGGDVHAWVQGQACVVNLNACQFTQGTGQGVFVDGGGEVKVFNCSFTPTGPTEDIEMGGLGVAPAQVFVANCYFNNVSSGSNYAFESIGPVNLSVIDVVVDGGGIVAELPYPGFLQIGSVLATGVPAGIRSRRSNNSPGGVFAFFTGAISISGALTAIEVEGPSSYIFDGTLTGTGNTDAVKVSLGGKVQISAASDIAATHELTIDGTVTTFAAMRAASPKLVSSPYFSLAYE